MKDIKSDRFVIREDAEIWGDLLVFNVVFGGVKGFLLSVFCGSPLC